jgi:DNA repair protein RecO (recombination protein O)
VPLVGEAALCALYLNELLMRLLARHDPHPGVFQRYSQVLFELAGAGTDGHAWVLRRFERDLLAELGYALVWETDVDGADVDASRRYVIDPERGPAPCDPMRSSGAVSGAALLALTREQSPSGELLRELRRMLRVVLRHHLGGRDLAAWSIRPPRLGPGPDLSE